LETLPTGQYIKHFSTVAGGVITESKSPHQFDFDAMNHDLCTSLDCLSNCAEGTPPKRRPRQRPKRPQAGSHAECPRLRPRCKMSCKYSRAVRRPSSQRTSREYPSMVRGTGEDRDHSFSYIANEASSLIVRVIKMAPGNLREPCSGAGPLTKTILLRRLSTS